MRCVSILIIIVFFFTSCVHEKEHLYSFQNAQEVNLFKEKNEVRARGYFNSGTDNKGFGFDAAYSVTNNYAFSLNYFQYKNSVNNYVNGFNTGNWAGSNFGLTFGRFKDFKKQGVFEIYAGFNYTTQMHNYTFVQEEWDIVWFMPVYSATATPLGNATIETAKYFLQPNYGVSFDIIELAVSTRVGYNSILSVKNNIQRGTNAHVEVASIAKDVGYFMFEPAITFRVGWRYAKFQTQLSYCATEMKGAPLSISFGLQLAFAKRYLKKETPVESTSSVLME